MFTQTYIIQIILHYKSAKNIQLNMKIISSEKKRNVNPNWSQKILVLFLSF